MNTRDSNSYHFPCQRALLWKNKLRDVDFARKFYKHKVILIILLWQCVNNMTYYLLLEPSVIIQRMDGRNAIQYICMEAILALFSPLAGLLADVIYGRFKVLKWSTYIMIAFEFLALVFIVIMSVVVDKINYTYYIMVGLLVAALLSYYFGNIFFLVNIIQFGIDQLRDSPTHYSVLFIHMFFWSNNFSHLLSKIFSSLSNHEIILNSYTKIVKMDSTQVLSFEVCLSISAIFSTIILFIVQRYSNYFFTDKSRGNPYKLVFSVIRYAIKHKQPVRRSAFTYCDDERPSRIDYGKQIYGGPFTTEQVEDVKSLLNIAKVLITLGPAFLLDLTGETIFKHYRNEHFSQNYYVKIFLQKDFLSPLLIAICIPFFYSMKPYFLRIIPNMFKRMGLSIIMANILFLLYLLFSSIASYDNRYTLGYLCSSNASYASHISLVDIPVVCMPIVQNILSSLHQMLLYIAAWEFICCQSPQNMKGILFGLLYSVKAFFQLLSAVFSYVFFINWKHRLFGCHSGFFLSNLVIGLVSLLIFTVVSRRYKYRKRDDICNIYQYAENYYSNIH